MRKLLKITAIVVAALILLVVAAAIIAPLVIQPNDYKDDIAKIVRERTGRELTFKGDIGLSVFPWLGLELGGLSLSNAQGFEDQPMLELDGMDIKVKLLPLLSKNIEINAVRVHGLKAYLGKDKQGRANWEDLLQAAGTSESATDETKAKPAEEGGFAIASLAVGEILVDKAQVIWDDRRQGQYYRLSDLEVGTGRISLGQPFDFRLSASFESRVPAVKGTISLTTHDEPADDYTRHLFKNTRLELHATGEVLPGGKADLVMTTDAQLDMGKHLVQLQNLTLDSMGLSLAGDVRLSDYDTAPRADVALESKEFNPRELMAALGLSAPQTTDPKALTKARLGLDVSASASAVEMRKLDVTLDDTKLTGTAKAKDFAKPDVRFDLSLDAIDVDRYLPPTSEKTEAAPAKKTDQKAEADQKASGSKLPKKALRALVLDGSLRAGSIKAYKITLTETTVKVTAKDGLLKVEPFSTLLYGGSLRTILTADVSTATTRSALNLKLSNTNLGTLLKDLMDKEMVTGQGALNLDVTAKGEDEATLRRTLNGTMDFLLKDGAIRGFQIVPNSVRDQAAAASTAVNPATGEKLKEQQFHDIKAKFKIVNGVVSNNDLAVDADDLQVTGEGTANLATEGLDYKVRADITGLPVIPFTIKGSFTDPSYSLDAKEFAKGIAKSLINAPEKAGKTAIDAGKNALEGLGKGLKGIFGTKKK